MMEQEGSEERWPITKTIRASNSSTGSRVRAGNCNLHTAP